MPLWLRIASALKEHGAGFRLGLTTRVLCYIPFQRFPWKAHLLDAKLGFLCVQQVDSALSAVNHATSGDLRRSSCDDVKTM